MKIINSIVVIAMLITIYPKNLTAKIQIDIDSIPEAVIIDGEIFTYKGLALIEDKLEDADYGDILRLAAKYFEYISDVVKPQNLKDQYIHYLRTVFVAAKAAIEIEYFYWSRARVWEGNREFIARSKLRCKKDDIFHEIKIFFKDEIIRPEYDFTIVDLFHRKPTNHEDFWAKQDKIIDYAEGIKKIHSYASLNETSTMDEIFEEVQKRYFVYFLCKDKHFWASEYNSLGFRDLDRSYEESGMIFFSPSDDLKKSKFAQPFLMLIKNAENKVHQALATE